MTTIEVLRNFKFALDNDLFLLDEFYADENLERVFAANKMSSERFTPTRKSTYVISQHAVTFFLIRGMFDENGTEIDSDKRQGSGVINASITADSIIEIFGKPLNVSNPYAAENWMHPTAVMPKTHDLGNLAIEYKFDRPHTSEYLNCLINGDGTVKVCNFRNTEK